MAINKAPIVGFVRYSQKIKFANSERDMFEPEYFEYRFNIFKNVTLRSFQQQTNPNFVLLLLHSESMPHQYKEKFIELENENTFLYNIFLKDTQESFDDAIAKSKEYVSFAEDSAVTFRIDNDDAVQNNFIEEMSHFLKNDFVGFSVSIPNQYIVKRIRKDEYLLQEFYFPANAVGLAYVTNKKGYKTVFNLGDHDLVNDKNSLILLDRFKNGGLMTINGENAINTMDESKAKTFIKKDLYQFLKDKKLENIDLECLRIFKKNKNISLKKNLKLLTPPIVNIIRQKGKKFFNIMRRE